MRFAPRRKLIMINCNFMWEGAWHMAVVREKFVDGTYTVQWLRGGHAIPPETVQDADGLQVPPEGRRRLSLIYDHCGEHQQH